MAIVNGIPRSVNPNTRIKGFDIVMARLNKEIKGIENRSEAGLIKATGLIRRETESTAPITPVDLGNLRSSWFVVSASKTQPKDSHSKEFKGKKKAELAINHEAVKTEAKGIIKANEGTKGKFVMMGYSANYALFVHEMMGSIFQRPGSGPKWLESAIKRNSGKIVQIIKDNVTIK